MRPRSVTSPGVGAPGRVRALAPRDGRGPDRSHAPAGTSVGGHLGGVRHRRRGLYKMEVGTPFATPLPLFRRDRVPRVFFVDDYVTTLAVKHALTTHP